MQHNHPHASINCIVCSYTYTEFFIFFLFLVIRNIYRNIQSSIERNLPSLQAGLLFFIGVFWGFFPVFTAIFTFPQERAMLSKERAADMYRLSAYFVARTTSDLPLDLILPVLFHVVVYFMAGLTRSAGPFFLSMLTIFLCIVAAQVCLL